MPPGNLRTSVPASPASGRPQMGGDISTPRRTHRRIRFAIQFGFLRYFGRAWTPNESVPMLMLEGSKLARATESGTEDAYQGAPTFVSSAMKIKARAASLAS